MEKYVSAAEWYLLGMALYFLYYMFIKDNPKGYIDYVHKEVPVPIPDGFILAIVVIVILLCSFVWPFSTIYDLDKTLKSLRGKEQT